MRGELYRVDWRRFEEVVCHEHDLVVIASKRVLGALYNSDSTSSLHPSNSRFISSPPLDFESSKSYLLPH